MYKNKIVLFCGTHLSHKNIQNANLCQKIYRFFLIVVLLGYYVVYATNLLSFKYVNYFKLHNLNKLFTFKIRYLAFSIFFMCINPYIFLNHIIPSEYNIMLCAASSISDNDSIFIHTLEGILKPWHAIFHCWKQCKAKHPCLLIS